MEKQKVVLITGGASGLGNVLVKEFIQEGYGVCFTFRSSKEKAQSLAEQFGEQVYPVCADASDYNKAFRVVRDCIKHFGRLDVLVNNAASAKDAPLNRIEKEDFDYTMQNVLYPVFNYSKAVCDYFIRSNWRGRSKY